MTINLTQPPSPSTSPALPESATVADRGLVIQPRRGWIGIDWPELVQYRELLAFLVWRDFTARYKQALLGAAWSLFVPLLSLGIYGMVAQAAGWGNLIGGQPVFLWMFAGLVPWLYLQRAINDGGNALLNNQPLMTKVYLPRLYLPTAACGNAAVDLAVNLVLLTLLGGAFLLSGGWTPGPQIVLVLPLLLLTFVAALGLAFTLSAATVLYRDLRFLIPFITQFGLWLSAVPYPLSIYDGQRGGELIKLAYALNPVTGIVSGWRSAIANQPWEWTHVFSAVVLSPLLLLFGLFYFRRVERRFADIA